jgi:hypothetical protein
MVTKKVDEEPEVTNLQTDKEFIVFETAYDTYKLKRPRGPKVGRDHLRLMQKHASKLSFDESMLKARAAILDHLKNTIKLTPEEEKHDLTIESKIANMLVGCGLKEPASPQEIENEIERQEKAEDEWLDKVLPEILVGKSIEEIPAEDFKVIFAVVSNAMNFRPDYFRIL